MSPDRLRGTRGVSLLEVVVALTILSTVILTLTGLMWQMGRQSTMAGLATSRTAALESASALVQTVRWDSLGTVVGCAADTAGTLTYTRCISQTTISANLRRVQVVIAPQTALVAPETLAVFRTRPRQASTLYLQ